MYLFPQPPPRRRAFARIPQARLTGDLGAPLTLGAIRVARLPLTPQMLARGLSVRAGVIAPVSGYILSASLRSPVASRPAGGPGKPKKPFDVPGTQPGGVPFAAAPRRQAGAFTQIGPGSMSSPAAAGQFQLRRRRSFSLGLGTITPDQAAQVAMPSSSISKTAGFTQQVYDDIVQAASNGNFTTFNPSGCQGIKPLGAAITSVAGGLALKFAGAAGPAAPVLLAVGAALEVFSFVFAHHAAAVTKERSVICAAVPAASDSITAIDQAVQNGTLTPDQGSQAMGQLLSSFKQTVTSILKMDSSHCNAACVWVKQLTAIVAKKQADYADLAAGGTGSTNPLSAVAAAVSGAVGGGASSLPSWLLPAAAFGILLWAL